MRGRGIDRVFGIVYPSRVTQTNQRLAEGVRDVPISQSPGFSFATSPHPRPAELFELSVQALVEPVRRERIDKVVGIERPGLHLAAPTALHLEAGLVLIRKKGKLPWQTYALAYALEYGEAEVEIHVDSIAPGENILLVDDLLATGGTAAAAQALVAEWEGISSPPCS